MTDFRDEPVRDHFFNPRNQGEIAHPDLVVEVGSIREGNAIKLMIKLDTRGRIGEAKFQSFGAGDCIAACSLLTEMLIGKSLDEAAKITAAQVTRRAAGSGNPAMLNSRQAVLLLRRMKEQNGKFWQKEEI